MKKCSSSLGKFVDKKCKNIKLHILKLLKNPSNYLSHTFRFMRKDRGNNFKRFLKKWLQSISLPPSLPCFLIQHKKRERRGEMETSILILKSQETTIAPISFLSIVGNLFNSVSRIQSKKYVAFFNNHLLLSLSITLSLFLRIFSFAFSWLDALLNLAQVSRAFNDLSKMLMAFFKRFLILRDHKKLSQTFSSFIV